MDINKLARQYGTPLFVIDLDKIKENFSRFNKAFLGSLIAYSYKTNFHPEVLKKIKNLSGFGEVISSQEIYFAERIGVEPKNMIYNGLGRQEEDFEKVILKGLFSININSVEELKKISYVSNKLRRKVDIGIRVNPKIEIEKKKRFVGKTSKFGIKIEDWEKVLEIIKNSAFLNLKIIFSDIGTNITNSEHYIKTFKILDGLAKGKIPYMDLGGGFASESILKENGKSIFDFGESINQINNNKYKLIFEPGRYIVEDACYCMTKILSIHNGWVITDIAGNFLIPLANANYRVNLSKGNNIYDFGGNLCFAADVIQENIKTKKLNAGEIIQINNVGAYTFSMRNNLGNLDPVILIKKDGKIRKYKDKGNPKILFDSMTP